MRRSILPSSSMRVAVNERDELGSDLVPDYALGPHTASLGLAFYDRTLFPRALPRRRRRPAWLLEPAPAQWLQGDLRPLSRRTPVGAGRGTCSSASADGALLVADDVGNAVWRLTPARSDPAD